MLDNYLINFFARLNNKRYISCYFLLNYDYSCILDIYVSYMSFVIIYFTNLKQCFVVIAVTISLEQSNNYIKLISNFNLHQTLEHKQLRLHISNEHQAEEKEQMSSSLGVLHNNTVVNLLDSIKLLHFTTAFNHC